MFCSCTYCTKYDREYFADYLLNYCPVATPSSQFVLDLVLVIMQIVLPNILAFFCPLLSSLLTYFTCDSQFFLSIFQCQGEWCRQHDSCPFPSGIHKWVISYFHKNIFWCCLISWVCVNVRGFCIPTPSVVPLMISIFSAL